MRKPRTLTEVAEEFLLQQELEKNAPSTGFPDLDKCIKGFLPGHLYTLTAQTNAGKTTLACNFADAVMKQDRKVLYVALEPDINVIATLASVRLNKAYNELTAEHVKLDHDLIHVLLQEDVGTLDQLVTIIKNSGNKYDLIIIDHISYFIQGDNTNAAQSTAIKKLALLAKTHRNAVLLIAHLKKDIRDDFITMDDISGSASFKQDSTDVLILLREKLNPGDLVSDYSKEAMIYVPKTKVYSKHKVCEILFQDNKAKILSKYYG